MKKNGISKKSSNSPNLGDLTLTVLPIDNGIDSTSGGQVSLRQSARERFFARTVTYILHNICISKMLRPQFI